MSVAIITGSSGLVGSEAAIHFAGLGFDVVGVDNDMRSRFFGPGASTEWRRRELEGQLRNYTHLSLDIRNEGDVNGVYARYGRDVALTIHAAAQPSHDWAAREPVVDFDVNARATLLLLEATRRHSPQASFIFTSTNKVYGDRPNSLPLVELETRWELPPDHSLNNGINESMPVDLTLHSVFGASKLAADVMVQEYGRYFGMNTVCFRGGCLTGPNHSGTQLHGFLAYLMHCAVYRKPYEVFGYKGKQVRDNIHSADLVRAFDEYRKAPRPAEVYNIGGSRFSNCSMLEAIRMSEEITGRGMQVSYTDQHRIGDHVWWISDVSRFRAHYPAWNLTRNIRSILTEIHEVQQQRQGAGA